MTLLLLLGFHSYAYANHSATNILILGDSLSAAHNIPVDKGWAHLFSSNIRSSFPQTSVVNASISGETTFGGLQRLPGLLGDLQPTHLIIELGGNDGLRGLGFAQSTDNLRQMVQLAEAREITVLLIGVRMPPNFGVAYNTNLASFQVIYAVSVIKHAEIGTAVVQGIDGKVATDGVVFQAAVDVVAQQHAAGVLLCLWL